jgi:hypothetical protein
MSDPTAKTVVEFAEQLREYATHFAPSDWDYTRDTSAIKHIRYADDYSGYNHPLRRFVRSVRHFMPWRDRDIFSPKGIKARLIYFKVGMRTEKHMPDGVLDGGCIVTHWEETGEYLQYVQPSVGAMLADWMDAEPSSPHALKIAGEMRRINARYGQRIADCEAEG